MGKLPFEYIFRTEKWRIGVKTDPHLGSRPEDRSIEDLIEYGIVNIDKPSGPTSHQVSGFVQKILGIKKSGHSGTLDPGVTGVLPIALGRATRVVQTLLVSGKEYICLMHLHSEVKEKVLKLTLNRFTGKIEQLPPVKSAIKRVKRTREIYYIELLEIRGKDILMRVGCEAGTYIRKLCYDIGKHLKVGAHMAELRRTKAGPFDESTLFTLQDLADAYYFYKEEGEERFLRTVIQPMEHAISHLPKIWVMDSTVNSLCNGVNLKVPGIAKAHDQIEEGDKVAVMTLKDELICLGTSKMSTKGLLKERGVAVLTEKVFMQSEFYQLDKRKIK